MTSREFTGRILVRLDELVAQTARAHGEDPDRAGLLVALSGGPDSVALLHLAVAWAAARGRPLGAAHFNHRLRGEGADRDEDFCRGLCARLGVPLTADGADCRPLARQRRRGLEDAARVLRLEFLARACGAQGLAAIATGHHRDDQAETVLLRVCRGTGLDGLRGMRPRRGRLIRPLLGEPRAAILAYLEECGLAWREDPTNREAGNRRSRVRRELLPLLEDIFGPGAGANAARLAELCEIDLAHLDELAATAGDALARPAPAVARGPDGAAPPPGLPALDAVGLVALPEAVARRVVRRWLRPLLPADLGLVHVRAVLRWLAGGRSGSVLDLPGPLRLERRFDEVLVARQPPPSGGAERWTVRLEPLPQPPDRVPAPWRDGETWRLIAAADGLDGPLHVRSPRPGDRLQPFGLAGRKKLSDLVREKRIPAALRPHLLVVADRSGPLWVVGVAQAERTRVLPTTGQAVTIVLDRHRPDPVRQTTVSPV